MEPVRWAARYPATAKESTSPSAAAGERSSLVEAWRERVGREPDARALAYFEGTMTVCELDEATDALAAGYRSPNCAFDSRVRGSLVAVERV